MSDQVNKEVDNVIKLDENYNDIFVSENDTFNISVEYYKDDKNNIIVNGIDDNFDTTRKSKEITITLKKPSQGDVSLISNSNIRANINSLENMTVNQFILLEVARFSILIRSWTLPNRVNNESIMDMNPKIIKCILNKIREEIGTEGII